MRLERTRRNIPLAELAEETRISARFLAAIEDENFNQLPGTVFTRNFVRQYALALQLDPEPLLAQLPRVNVADAPLPSAPARSRDHEPRWDPRWNSAIASVFWLVLAVGAIVGAYIHFNHDVATKAEPPRPVPVAQAPAKTEPEPVSRPEAAVPASPASPAADPATISQPQPTDPAHPVHVVVTAREESWVQVTADGKVAFSATLQPNETRSVAAVDQVKVVTGNAGGILLSLNGKPLDPLGPSGQVRTVRLTAEGLQLVQKTPTQSPPDPL